QNSYHYGTVGFYPLVAFDGMTDDFLKTKLHQSNEHTSHGMVPFVQPVIKHYNKKFPETTPFLHSNSGFAVPPLYKLCERIFVFYVILLKANANLKKLADELHPSVIPLDNTQTES